MCSLLLSRNFIYNEDSWYSVLAPKEITSMSYNRDKVFFSSTNGLFIFDEPTTGLHYNDINKLLRSINSLIEKGNTVIIIEHNIELIKCADHLIDLGPKGGNKGGKMVAMGKPEEIILEKESITAKYLKKVLL